MSDTPLDLQPFGLNPWSHERDVPKKQSRMIWLRNKKPHYSYNYLIDIIIIIYVVITLNRCENTVIWSLRTGTAQNFDVKCKCDCVCQAGVLGDPKSGFISAPTPCAGYARSDGSMVAMLRRPERSNELCSVVWQDSPHNTNEMMWCGTVRKWHMERLEERNIGIKEAFNKLDSTAWKSYWRMPPLWEWFNRVERTNSKEQTWRSILWWLVFP